MDTPKCAELRLSKTDAPLPLFALSAWKTLIFLLQCLRYNIFAA